MFRKTNRKLGAFSLMELVVVVLILGLIAAIAAPRMYDAANDAKQNSTKTSLAALRDAIELYKAQNGSYPPAATLPSALDAFLQGPFPAVQMGANQNANVVATSQAPIVTPEGGGAGWAYNEASGDIAVNEGSFIAW